MRFFWFPSAVLRSPMNVPVEIKLAAQAVTPEELANDEEYSDILEDMREECGKVRRHYHEVWPANYFDVLRLHDFSCLYGDNNNDNSRSPVQKRSAVPYL